MFFVFAIFSNYGVDFEGPVPPQDSESVEVPQKACPFNFEDLNGMEQFVAAEGMKLNVVELFINAVEFVSGLLN